MAKRTTEAYISQMEKTSEYWKKKANREYPTQRIQMMDIIMCMQIKHILKQRDLRIKQKMQDFMDISGGECIEGSKVLQSTVLI